MLRNIDPILGPDLLHTLRAMGHGDEIVISDANFPAESLETNCIRADGVNASRMLEAILSVMPLDNFEDKPVLTMAVANQPEVTPETHEDFQKVIDRIADYPAAISALERFAFYQHAQRAFAIVITGERRLYGNIILRKGIIEQ